MVGINMLAKTIRNSQIMVGNQGTKIHEVTFQNTVISVLILFCRIRIGLSIFLSGLPTEMMYPFFIPLCTLDVLLY